MAKKPAQKTASKAATGGNAKAIDMRTKSDDQLSESLVDLKREAFNLRFQAATNQLERPARIREVRRDIARIKTLQTERQSASAGSAEAK